jgi:hypothetical protein
MNHNNRDEPDKVPQLRTRAAALANGAGST